MITLTTPHPVNSVLGGDAPIDYDKLVLAPFTMDGVAKIITAQVRMTSTGNASMQPIIGLLKINANAGVADLVIEVGQMDFYRRIALSAGQITAVLNQIEAAQAQLENGLIALGVVAGTRSAGV
jgi:hypothetical protein